MNVFDLDKLSHGLQEVENQAKIRQEMEVRNKISEMKGNLTSGFIKPLPSQIDKSLLLHNTIVEAIQKYRNTPKCKIQKSKQNKRKRKFAKKAQDYNDKIQFSMQSLGRRHNSK